MASLLTDSAWGTYNNKALKTNAVNSGDPMGHGAHVCGIVAAIANNGLGVAGTSRNAKVQPIGVQRRHAQAVTFLPCAKMNKEKR
ncbi:S8 family serine peptidase [Collinsella aerofaciens]|uniref:S8 family serine peptidase n=1 Tax=Collinsella aerofaciens TaxID=74426 RepID=UPI003981FB29